jgi:glutamyl-tRNA synthetase
MHIGTVRTALFNYLIARQSEGAYFARIEDTDTERNRPEWYDAIKDDFAWLHLNPDRYDVQSEHRVRHQELLRKLVSEGKAYASEEAAKDGSGRLVTVVRLRNTGKNVSFTDLVRGSISFDTAELGDFVIARSIEDPLYHFAVVVDDADAGVTHVIRAEEHISNTPRQILILNALGFPVPQYAHIPLILAPDRSKLSKRKHAVSIADFRDRGFIPEGIINYLALLGWNPGTEQELFTIGELIQIFSIDKLQKGGAIFDEVKMRWFNKEHLRRITPEDYRLRLEAYLGTHEESIPEYLPAVLELVRERTETLADAAALLKSGEFAFMEDIGAIDAMLLTKGAKAGTVEAADNLMRLQEVLAAISETEWNLERIKMEAMSIANEKGKAQTLWPMRVALSGREKSPDPFIIAELSGKERTLERMKAAVQVLTGASSLPSA